MTSVLKLGVLLQVTDGEFGMTADGLIIAGLAEQDAYDLMNRYLCFFRRDWSIDFFFGAPFRHSGINSGLPGWPFLSIP